MLSQRESQILSSFSKILLHKIIQQLFCEESFMALVNVKRRVKTVQKVTFILLILQMSALFLYKHGIACFILSSLTSLGTLVFVLIDQNSQISALQSSLYQVCNRALLDHLQSNPDGDSMEDTLAE